MSSSATAILPGRLGSVLAEYGQHARIHDLYDEVGSRIYDDSTQSDMQEIRVLRRLLRTCPGEVLELAAGSGRVTLPLLGMDRDVTALELSPHMIDRLRDNRATLSAEVQNRLSIVEADMRAFSLEERFGVVVLLAASISLLDDDGRRQMLGSVRDHLADRGVLLFSLVVPAHPWSEDAGDDAVNDLQGRSGRTYRVHDHRAAGSRQRTVGVYPLYESDAPFDVCVSTHYVLDLEDVIADVEHAGLTVAETWRVQSGLSGLDEVYVRVEMAP